jgi:hypothetical protein
MSHRYCEDVARTQAVNIQYGTMNLALIIIIIIIIIIITVAAWVLGCDTLVASRLVQPRRRRRGRCQQAAEGAAASIQPSSARPPQSLQPVSYLVLIAVRPSLKNMCRCKTAHSAHLSVRQSMRTVLFTTFE